MSVTTLYVPARIAHKTAASAFRITSTSALEILTTTSAAATNPINIYVGTSTGGDGGPLNMDSGPLFTTNISGSILMTGGNPTSGTMGSFMIEGSTNLGVVSPLSTQFKRSLENWSWITNVSPIGPLILQCKWSPYLGKFCAISTTTGNLLSSDGITWSSGTCPLDPSAIAALCWSQELGIFCALSDTGSARVALSSNGITWTTFVGHTTANWRTVVWAAEIGIFCAVGPPPSAGNSPRCMTSFNGTTWTTQLCTTGMDINGIAWSPELGIFVAVGDGGTSPSTERAATSPNGVIWTTRATLSGSGWYKIAWSSELNIFVAVGTSGTNRAMISSNGITWTAGNLGTTFQWSSIAYSPQLKLFCARAGFAAEDNVVGYTTGTIWITIASSVGVLWRDIDWSPKLSVFCSAGYNIALTTGYLAISTRVYPNVTLGTNISTSILNGNLVVTTGSGVMNLGNYSSSLTITDDLNITGTISNSELPMQYLDINAYTSNVINQGIANLNQWNMISAASTTTLVNVLAIDELDLYVAIGGTSPYIFTSPDGIAWTSRVQIAASWRAICWSPEMQLLVITNLDSASFRVISSKDAINWTTSGGTSTGRWFGMCWSKEYNLFVGISDSGSGIIYSNNGFQWGTFTIAPALAWRSIAWSGEQGIFVGVSATVGSTARAIYSIDGFTWVSVTCATATGMHGVVWSSELQLFCCVPFVSSPTFENSLISISYTGTSWLTVNPGIQNGYANVTWNPDLRLFTALSINTHIVPNLIYSANALTWNTITVQTNVWYANAWSRKNKRYVAVSNLGTQRIMHTNDNFGIQTINVGFPDDKIEISSTELTLGSNAINVEIGQSAESIYVLGQDLIKNYYYTGYEVVGPATYIGGLIFSQTPTSTIPIVPLTYYSPGFYGYYPNISTNSAAFYCPDSGLYTLGFNMYSTITAGNPPSIISGFINNSTSYFISANTTCSSTANYNNNIGATAIVYLNLGDFINIVATRVDRSGGTGTFYISKIQ